MRLKSESPSPSSVTEARLSQPPCHGERDAARQRRDDLGAPSTSSSVASRGSVTVWPRTLRVAAGPTAVDTLTQAKVYPSGFQGSKCD